MKYTKTEIVAAGALILGSLGIGTQSADAATIHWNKPLAQRILDREAPIIRHNTHLRGRMHIRCGDPYPNHRCVIKVRSKRTGKVKFVLKLDVKRVPPPPADQLKLYEDYSGFIKDAHGRVWYIDPPCQPASPCVDG